MNRSTATRWGLVVTVALLVACKRGQPDPTDPGTTPPEETGGPDGPPGFDIGGVTARDAQMRYVADVVQVASGEVVAVGTDLAGSGAVHLVGESAVSVLHAGPPLGQPTSVDLDATGTIVLTDAGGSDESTAVGVATGEAPALPSGGVFSLDASGGAPSLITAEVRSPQGIVAASDDVLYVTGFTADGEPGVFSISGGAVITIAEGPPLVQPGDISVVGDPDATQLWVIDVSGGQDGVANGGANLVALNPPAGEVIEVSDGMTAIGVTGRGPDALVTTTDHNGDARIEIVDVTDGERRGVDAQGVEMSVNVTGAGAGADPTLPVWAGGNSGQVFLTHKP